MPLSTATDRESQEFLRKRVASFGLFSGGFALLFWVFRVSRGDNPFDWDSLSHLLASLILLANWPLLRWPRVTVSFIRGVESVSLLASCGLFVSMGVTIPLLPNRSDMLMLLVLTFVTCSRAVYVPSSASRTAILDGLVGLCLLAGVYYASAVTPLEPIQRFYPNVVVTSADLSMDLTLNAAMWWLLSAGLSFATSKVIYGLRKNVREVRQLGQYNLHHKIGEGGMGIVYEAHHAMLRRSTAVKLLLPDNAGQGSLDRFEREVKLTARLRHPNTVTVYDYGRTPDGVFYYAMELLDGATLGQIVRSSGPMPAARVVFVLKRVAGALSEAHGLGLIHRDIKPENIMLCSQGGQMDVTKVLDFGLVKDINPSDANDETAAQLTQTNAITGTPLYMAPEAIKAPSSVGIGSDLYALGAVGYFLLTGTHVFEGTNVIEICACHLHETPEPLAERLGKPVPEDLAALILDCLAKDPKDRPASAEALLERLVACQLPAWTQAEAKAWWKENTPDTSAGKPSKAASSQTILIDLARRSPSLQPRSQ